MATERPLRYNPQGIGAKRRARSTHGMSTRSKPVHFQFLDLPAELRNHIYSYAFSSEDELSLATLTLPQELSLSRQLRSEAVPFFFTVNTFEASVRCNWCTFNTHFHKPYHNYYDETGIVEVSPLLIASNEQARGASKLSALVPRFHHFNFTILCCCCEMGRHMATLYLSFKGGRVIPGYKIWEERETTRASLEMMYDEVKLLFDRVSESEVFDGFTVGDIKEVAMCFRYKKKSELEL